MPGTIIEWDAAGEHWYQTGVDKVALYVWDSANKKYGAPVAWNGVTAITESPSGAESNKQYADNIEYLNLLSREEFGCTLEAYQSPEAFDECDGEKAVTSTATGLTSVKIKVHGMPRKKFALAYRTLKGNDSDAADTAIATGATNKFTYHIIYGCLAAPSSVDNNTVNDSPEAATLSWEITTTPITDATDIGTTLTNAGVTRVAHLEFDADDSTVAGKIEELLYTSGQDCPLPKDLLGA